jgi:hypothetical protein
MKIREIPYFLYIGLVEKCNMCKEVFSSSKIIVLCMCVFHFYLKLQFQIAVSVFRVGPSTRKWRQQVLLRCWYPSRILQLFVEHRWTTGNESVEVHWKGKEGDIYL